MRPEGRRLAPPPPFCRPRRREKPRSKWGLAPPAAARAGARNGRCASSPPAPPPPRGRARIWLLPFVCARVYVSVCVCVCECEETEARGGRGAGALAMAAGEGRGRAAPLPPQPPRRLPPRAPPPPHGERGAVRSEREGRERARRGGGEKKSCLRTAAPSFPRPHARLVFSPASSAGPSQPCSSERSGAASPPAARSPAAAPGPSRPAQPPPAHPRRPRPQRRPARRPAFPAAVAHAAGKRRRCPLRARRPPACPERSAPGAANTFCFKDILQKNLKQKIKKKFFLRQ